MMKYINLLISISMVVFIGCNGKKEGNIKSNFKNQYNLSVELLDSSVFTADPTYVFTDGTYIIWKDPFNGYNITIYDIESKQSKRLLKKGNGPDEYTQTPFIYCYNSDKRIVIETFTPGINRVSQYSFQSLHDSLLRINTFELTTDMKTIFSSNPSQDKNIAIPMRGVLTRENTYVSLGFFNSLFGIYRNGLYLKSSINFLEPPTENVSNYHQSASSLNTVFQFNHKMNKLALGYIFGKVLSVYSVDNDSIITDWASKDFLPYYTTSKTNVIADSKKTRYAYVDITSTDEYIYALYSGQLVEDNISSHYSKSIEVFTWHGVPVCKFSIDTPLTCISVSNDNRYIYGFGNSENTFSINLYTIKIPQDVFN